MQAQLAHDIHSQEQAAIFAHEDVNNFFQVHVDKKTVFTVFLYIMIRGKKLLGRR
jgi:hypothetical protein